MRTSWKSASLLAVAVVLIGCGRGVGPGPRPPAGPTTPPEVLREFLALRRDPGVEQNPLLRSGDVIQIHAEEAAEVNGNYTIGRGGVVVVPLIGRIRATGRTPAALGERLKRRLEAFVMKPKVDVAVVGLAGRTVLLTGAVQKEAPVNLGASGKTLLEVLTLAGGFSPEAAGYVRVIPTASELPGLFADPEVAASAEKNPGVIEIAAAEILRGGEEGAFRLYLRPGDVIEVPEAVESRPGSPAAARAPEIPAAKPQADVEVEPEADRREETTRTQEPPAVEALGGAGEEAPLGTIEPEPAEVQSPPAPEEPPPEPVPTLPVDLQLYAAAPAPAVVASLPAPVENRQAELTEPDLGSVSVIGLVAKPGMYRIGEVNTVAQVLILAGRRAGANLAAVEIERQMPDGPARSIVNVEEIQQGRFSDEPLRAGDTITVPGLDW